MKPLTDDQLAALAAKLCSQVRVTPGGPWAEVFLEFHVADRQGQP